MRRYLKLLAVAVLLLPSCILVTDQYDDDHGRKSSLERRVTELEAQLHDCKAACAAAGCNCMGGKAAAGTASP